jgi:hypothetical protein
MAPAPPGLPWPHMLARHVSIWEIKGTIRIEIDYVNEKHTLHPSQNIGQCSVQNLSHKPRRYSHHSLS